MTKTPPQVNDDKEINDESFKNSIIDLMLLLTIRQALDNSKANTAAVDFSEATFLWATLEPKPYFNKYHSVRMASINTI